MSQGKTTQNKKWYTHISQLTQFIPPPENIKSEIGSQPTMCWVYLHTPTVCDGMWHTPSDEFRMPISRRPVESKRRATRLWKDLDDMLPKPPPLLFVSCRFRRKPAQHFIPGGPGGCYPPRGGVIPPGGVLYTVIYGRSRVWVVQIFCFSIYIHLGLWFGDRVYFFFLLIIDILGKKKEHQKFRIFFSSIYIYN